MGGWREWPARRELAKVATGVLAALAVKAGMAVIVMWAGMAVMGHMVVMVVVAVWVATGVDCSAMSLSDGDTVAALLVTMEAAFLPAGMLGVVVMEAGVMGSMVVKVVMAV